LHPNEKSKEQRDDAVEQNPPGMPNPADPEIKNQFQNSLKEKKYRQHERQREDAQKRVHQHINSRDAVDDRQEHLPQNRADAVTLEGKD
jgi:hypothetical protein